LLCCIGDLVEDIVVWLPSEIAKGTDTNVSIMRRRGGSAANVAVSAASAGARVRFIGRVGSDVVGAALVEELSAGGVDARVHHEGRTATIVVLVDAEGERSMLPDRGAATQLEAISDDDLDGVTWLHVPAYSLVVEPLATATLRAIQSVQRTGGTVSIDASSVAIIDRMGVERFSEMLTNLAPDIVFCNQDEGLTLGVESRNGLVGVDVTIVKAGAGMTVAYRDNEVVAALLPSPLSDVRDTTGAGDAFAAGFIVAYMESDDIASAIKDANDSAARLITRHSS
jgi:sugar/nucleoside kinase (ribokinase family)